MHGAFASCPFSPSTALGICSVKCWAQKCNHGSQYWTRGSGAISINRQCVCRHLFTSEGGLGGGYTIQAVLSGPPGTKKVRIAAPESLCRALPEGSG